LKTDKTAQAAPAFEQILLAPVFRHSERPIIDAGGGIVSAAAALVRAPAQQATLSTHRGSAVLGESVY
jgi:hypothetical protein